MRVQHHAFNHVEDGIRLVDLKNEDEKYLKQNGFSKLPSCIQGVQFSCLGKYYQGFGFRNDIGGVEFFHQLYTPFPVTLKSYAPTTLRSPKAKEYQACCLFYDFMDYLAFYTLKGSREFRLPQHDACIVMSHVSNYMHMVVDSDDYDEVYMFFPNTVVGRTIALTLKRRNPGKVTDYSIIYKGHANLRAFVQDKNESIHHVFKQDE